MKRLAIGVSDFKKIIKGDFYYFDKTKLIEEIINDGSEVKLFTRPRRFGKTLNMSTLKYFFDVENKEENKKLFKGLYIEKTDAFKEQGQYPVIFLSLKDLKASNWEEMEEKISVVLSDLFSEYEYLINDLLGSDSNKLKKIINEDANLSNLGRSLKLLTKILYEKYNKKVVVLIDEYDSPLVSAYINGYYENAKDFFKTFYSSVLKDNNYLQMGVLTGIIRVIKAGIFSDLNNLSTYTILSDDYTDSYGLTEEEVEKSLKDYGIEAEISNVKDWYDGYKFGDSEVYNPWSIINFLRFKELYIEKTESFKEQGQHPVVFLSLKDLKATTWEEMERKIIITLSDFLSEYEYLLNELTGINFENLKNIVYKKASIDDLTTALKFLTKILYEKYNKKIVVLVDEYDSPLVSAYINGYYEKAKNFFKTFYSLVLKDNNCLQMGVLTGIIRVIKAGIFSDLNNLSTYTILSDDYTDSYGLTEEEVEKSLKDYGIEAEISKVKDWYDGYKFGDSEVYNPWSILNFLQDKELRAYWVDTSGNDLINNVLKIRNKNIITALEKLFNGDGLKQNLSGTSDLSKILSDDEIWELLLFSGYLTVEKKINQDNYILRLPNKEVKSLFRKTFIETYIARGSKLSFLMESLIENKIEDYEENLQEILLTSVSYNDTKKGNEAILSWTNNGNGLIFRRRVYNKIQYRKWFRKI